VVSAYTAGPDVHYLCAPLCIRQNTETTVTWAAYTEKEDMKILCWTQSGINSVAHSIQISIEENQEISFLPVDESGENVLCSHGDSRFTCYTNQQSHARWTWEPGKPTHMEVFRAKECPLTEKSEGFMVMLVFRRIDFYSIKSPGDWAEAIFSIPLNRVILVLDKLTLDVCTRIYCLSRTVCNNTGIIWSKCKHY
jgi:hypothetical protein